MNREYKVKVPKVPKVKKERTSEQIQNDKDKMAKIRAMKKPSV